jgi:biopolymer transport protein ExbD
MMIRISSGHRRQRRLSLTSLIDVIFLLLLFFMLSSTFTRFAAVELSGGDAAVGATGQPDIVVRLADTSWSINGRDFDRDAAIVEMARLEAAGGESVVLLVGDAATSQSLVDAIEQIRGQTGLSLQVAR